MEERHEFKCVRCEQVLQVGEEQMEPIGMSCGHNLCRLCGNLLVNDRGLEIVDFCCNGSRIAKRVDARFVLNPKNWALMEVVKHAGRTAPSGLLAPTDCEICGESMKSFGDKVPYQLSLGCGHTICKACVQSLVRENPNPTCPIQFCGEKIRPNPSGSFPINLVLQGILHRYERVYQECQVHPGQLKMFMCQRHECNSALLCFQCTRNGPHSLHPHVHNMGDAHDLRQKIRETAATYGEVATHYQRDIQEFLDTANTFRSNHPDRLNLQKSIEDHFSSLLQTRQNQERKQAELRYVSEYCEETIAKMQENSQHKRVLTAEAARQPLQILNLLVHSDSELIRRQVQIRSSLGDPSLCLYRPANFEAQRLGAYYMKRNGSEFKLELYYDVEISIGNEESERVWEQFLEWLGAVGTEKGFNPRNTKDGVMFDFERDIMRLKVFRRAHVDQQRFPNSVQFLNVFRDRTVSLHFKENRTWIDNDSFVNIEAASTILLDSIHGLLLED